MKANQTGSKRILALDLGKTRIGIALSDPLGLTAQPLETIETRQRQQAIARIRKMARRHKVAAVVVGMPYNMDGTEGDQARWVRRFAEELMQKLVNIELVFWDERLTSVASEAVLIESGMKEPERKHHRDKIAAALILQSYLESRRIRQKTEQPD